jgi:hypothetical protein
MKQTIGPTIERIWKFKLESAISPIGESDQVQTFIKANWNVLHLVNLGENSQWLKPIQDGNDQVKFRIVEYIMSS